MGGGGRGGWLNPPLPKKSRAVGHCPRVLRCRCARVSLSMSSPGVLRKRVLGWKGWTCGAQGCDVKPPQPLLPWQSVGCDVVRCGGGCAVRVGAGAVCGGGGRAARDDFVLCHGQRAACMACVWEVHWHCPCADNGLGSEGGIAVAAALKTNTSLSSLNLWGMPVLHHVPTQHMCAPQCARPCLRTFAVVSEGPVDRLRWICGIQFFYPGARLHL